MKPGPEKTAVAAEAGAAVDVAAMVETVAAVVVAVAVVMAAVAVVAAVVAMIARPAGNQQSVSSRWSAATSAALQLKFNWVLFQEERVRAVVSYRAHRACFHAS